MLTKEILIKTMKSVGKEDETHTGEGIKIEYPFDKMADNFSR